MQKYLGLIILFLLASCSKNIFDEIADKETPAAIYFQAKREINKGNYSLAITLLESLDDSYLQVRERVPVYASAYAGRCGLVFLTLLDNIQNAGSGSVLVTLMSGFPGALASHVTDCMRAETILESLGGITARSSDENLLMAFVSLAKIGAILASLADTDRNGTADAGFNQCDATDLPEAMVREVGAGIAVTLLSLTAVGTSYVDDAMADITSLCQLNPNLAAVCTNIDPAVFTAPQVQALRYAIGSNDFGVNSCGNRNFTACAAANPVCP